MRFDQFAFFGCRQEDFLQISVSEFSAACVGSAELGFRFEGSQLQPAWQALESGTISQPPAIHHVLFWKNPRSEAI